MLFSSMAPGAAEIRWLTPRAFEERGFTVHTPTLRYHELPIEEGARLIAPLSLRDFADDLGLGTRNKPNAQSVPKPRRSAR